MSRLFITRLDKKENAIWSLLLAKWILCVVKLRVEGELRKKIYTLKLLTKKFK